MIIRHLSFLLRKLKAKKNNKGVRFSIFSRFCSKTHLSDYVSLYSNTVLSNVQVGRFTYFAGASVGNAVVGAFCSIGPGVKIGGMGHHPTNMVSTHPSFYSTLGQVKKTFAEKNFFDELPITKVGNDVWVGANAVVLDGLSIGNGAIIAAGAVVIRDVPDYAVVAGVPARVIKYRFNKERIRLLNQASWWDWSEDELQAIAPLMRKADDDFFNYLKSKVHA